MNHYPKIILNPLYRAYDEDWGTLDSRSLVEIMKWGSKRKTQTIVLVRLYDDGTISNDIKYVYSLIKDRYIRTV